MNAFLTKNLPQIKNICADHAVSTLYVFGSLVKGSFTKNSDVDLLVNFKPIPFGRYAGNYLDFVEKLEKTLKRPVDLVTEKYIDNPFLQQALDKTKYLIFDMKEEIKVLLYDVLAASQAIAEYLEQTPEYKDFVANRMVRRAVEREFEIIGEAINKINKLDPSLELNHQRAIVGLRNRIAHAYNTVDYEILWEVAQTHIPILTEEVNAHLTDSEH